MTSSRSIRPRGQPLARRVAAGTVLFGLAILATAPGIVHAQDGPVRYRDPVFQQVQRLADVVYGQATDVPTGRTVDLKLDLYEPAGDREPARPVLVFIHGGGFVGGDKSAGRRWAEEFARRGWVAVSIGYRLNQGNLATVGIPAAVSDARQALRWLTREAATHRLDLGRVVIGGSSAGAITALYLTYTEMEERPEDAGSAVAGVMDLWGALYGREREMTADEPPLIIVHGTQDTVVPYRYAEDLRRQAEAVGIPHAFHPLEGVGHGSNDAAGISEWTAEFFFPLLWPEPAAPSATPTATETPLPPASSTSPPPTGTPTGRPSVPPTVLPTEATAATPDSAGRPLFLPLAVNGAGEARGSIALACRLCPRHAVPGMVALD
jgi:acetyl esterase/lipase